jgi:Kdo2-lipid IVA lauroyltransferase/acyltransferase
MAKKPRNPKLDYLIYLVVRSLVCILQAVPKPMAIGFARLLAALAYQVDKRHREVARENLNHAFPELKNNPAKIDRMIRGCYHHYALVLIEILIMPRCFHVHNWRDMGKLVNGKGILRPLLGNRPVLIVTGHYGNWEMAGFAMGTFGFKTYAIARVLDNPHLEKFLKYFRQKTGQTILAKKGDFENITEVLARGGAIATLADQDAGERGQFVNFFNRPASTHKAVALMAMQFDALMVVVGIPRVGRFLQYEIQIEDVIDPRDFAQDPKAIQTITERYTNGLERLVRNHPEQYFWLHRRWKNQPKERKKKAQAV